MNLKNWGALLLRNSNFTTLIVVLFILIGCLCISGFQQKNCALASESFSESEVESETVIHSQSTGSKNKKAVPPFTVCKGLLVPSNISASQLKRVLYYELKEYAEDFVEAEKETGVNAIFLASVAALESGWGRSNVAKNKNNLYGWTTDEGDYMLFNSKKECISFVASKFKELYLSPNGKYFKGYEVESVNYYYNGSPAWAEAVNDIINGINYRLENIIHNKEGTINE